MLHKSKLVYQAGNVNKIHSLLPATNINQFCNYTNNHKHFQSKQEFGSKHVLPGEEVLNLRQEFGKSGSCNNVVKREKYLQTEPQECHLSSVLHWTFLEYSKALGESRSTWLQPLLQNAPRICAAGLLCGPWNQQELRRATHGGHGQRVRFSCSGNWSHWRCFLWCGERGEKKEHNVMLSLKMLQYLDPNLQIDSKHIWKCKRPRRVKAVLKKDKVRRLTT